MDVLTCVRVGLGHQGSVLGVLVGALLGIPARTLAGPRACGTDQRRPGQQTSLPQCIVVIADTGV